MRLNRLLVERRNSHEKIFVAYITAGDRSLDDTYKHVLALRDANVDLIELGVPHSDPVADGPTNQLAAARALKNNCSISDILHRVKQWRVDGLKTPLVLFTYFNPILRMGIEEFAVTAKRAGIDGVLVVDLPPEEAGDYINALREHEIETIFLASPTTDVSRLACIDASTTGFVYYVSRLGVTGVQTSLSASLDEELVRLRRNITKPILVGFGISTSEQAHAAAAAADGVIVGSAFVKLIETTIDPDLASRKLKELAERLVSATKSRKTLKENSSCLSL